MTTPNVFLTILIAFALVGLACLILTFALWNTVGRLVSDLWVKIPTKVISLASGSASLIGAYSLGTQKEEWFSPVLAGVVSVAIWETVGFLIDNRIKAADRIDKGELDRAEVQSELRTKLLTVFRFAVDGKARRTRRQLDRPPQKFGLPHVRNALTPNPHLGELLQSLAVFFQDQLPSGSGENRNFRVGVYANVDHAMKPVQGMSLNDASYTPFSSYDAHQEVFRLESANTRPAHVVNGVRRKGMVIVEDCAKAAERGEFHFFSEGQRSYLRSMVAYYLGEVSREDGTISEGVLVVDTEAAGFFKDSERDSIEFCLREFGARLRLEMFLIALLTPRRGNP